MTRDIRATCPSCNYEVDGATAPEDPEARPEEGDLAVCIRCAGPGVYVENEDGTLGLRAATEEEKSDFQANPLFVQAQEFIRAQSTWFQP